MTESTVPIQVFYATIDKLVDFVADERAKRTKGDQRTVRRAVLDELSTLPDLYEQARTYLVNLKTAATPT